MGGEGRAPPPPCGTDDEFGILFPLPGVGVITPPPGVREE